MKHCTNCGLKIAQDVTTCPRCGAFVPSPTALLAADTSPSTTTAPLADGVQTPLPPPPYVPQQQTPLFLTPPPPPSNSGTFPGDPIAARQTPMYGTAFSQTHVPYPPHPQARRGLSRGIVALILILALLLVSSGFGLIYYTTVAHPAQLHAQATAAVQTMLTTNANSTAVANTQATGTTVAYSNATATVQTQATAQAQSTVTALQNIYTQATQGTPALNSSLAGQDNYNWDVNDTTDGGGCGFNTGTYHSTLFSKNFYFPCFARASNFSNFAFQAQLTINQGDEGGLVFRSNSNSDLAQFYLFSINQSGSYRLEVSKDRTHNTSLAEDTSSAIKTGTGQPNTLAVVAKGGTLYLYINKQYVGSASDNTYSSGMLGVFASDASTTTDVSFSNAQVWTL